MEDACDLCTTSPGSGRKAGKAKLLFRPQATATGHMCMLTRDPAPPEPEIETMAPNDWSVEDAGVAGKLGSGIRGGVCMAMNEPDILHRVEDARSCKLPWAGEVVHVPSLRRIQGVKNNSWGAVV